MLACSAKISPCKTSAIVSSLYFKFITCSSNFFATMYLAHFLAIIDTFAINCVRDEAAILGQLHILKNKVAAADIFQGVSSQGV